MDFVPDSSSSREGDNNETSGGTNQKRDDDEEDDQLSEDDFELVEENFGSKMKIRKTDMPERMQLRDVPNPITSVEEGSAESDLAPSPVLAIAAQVENIVVAGPLGIFAANPGLLERRLRCQDYDTTGRCPRPIGLCPFTHGYEPPCAVHRALMDIERFRPQQPDERIDEAKNTQKRVTLSCICARVIRQNAIPLDRLPHHLQVFVARHSAGPCHLPCLACRFADN
ncbi:uncharacterized protein LOC124313290 isoform X2 [Daphnia pulicaria]|nr:uncharacterized protein LOC124313290 isoform X2 [Daphnia pulicaria]XP_046634099.1 uncharacterized protein LOC124313290 isoform X2 [Daphnia pulicaria]